MTPSFLLHISICNSAFPLLLVSDQYMMDVFLGVKRASVAGDAFLFSFLFLIQWPAKQSRSDLAEVPLAQLAHNAAAKSDVQTAAGKVKWFLCVKN